MRDPAPCPGGSEREAALDALHGHERLRDVILRSQCQGAQFVFEPGRRSSAASWMSAPIGRNRQEA